jgi:DNA-binding response OmpR family regulator
LRRIASDLPDLVILDLMMPEVDGWKVLQALRELATPHPRVVVLSAYADAPAAFEAGAAECLSKPFDINQLLATCERLLSN